MIQIPLTSMQLQVLKEALEFYLDGFSEDDAPNEYAQADYLQKFIATKIKESPNNEQ